MSSKQHTLPITLIKDYYWCPLKAYYEATLWNPPPTQSMQTGRELQSTARARLLELLEQKHELREILWEQPVESRRLGLKGRVDLAAITAQDRLVIVDIKLQPISLQQLTTSQKHVLIQLAAYTIAAEETLKHSTEKAYIYSIEAEKLQEAPITPRLRKLVEHAAKQLHQALLRENPPRPTPSRRKCRTCRYNTICPYAKTQA